MSFGIDVAKAAKDTKSTMGEAKQAIVFELFGNVIKKTPVDLGPAKNAWNVSMGTPDLTMTDIKSKSALGAFSARSLQELGKVTDEFGVDILTNPLPYARILEFGGYNYNPKSGKTTAEGFSTQAPAGMIRVSVSEFSAIAKKQGWV